MNIKRSLGFFCFIILLFTDTFSQAYPDRHSTSLKDGWLSCQTSANPNPIRGNGHWISYNLGDTYALTTSTIWNFNTPERINSYNNESWSLNTLPGKLEDGMRDVLIDISLDGITWKEWGRFSIPKATGSSFYEGVFGPDFSGAIARYILITGVSNHGGSCYGLGEVRFKGTIASVSNTIDHLDEAKISAAPNPFNDQTIISLKDFPLGAVRLSLKDVTGREVKSFGTYVNSNNENIVIKSENLASGIYLLNITQNEGSKTIKLEIIK